MRIILIVAALLCAVVPTSAQSPQVYTNADLTSKPVTWSRSVTAEEWRGLLSREFRPPAYPDRATVYVIPSSPASDMLPAPFPYRVSSSIDPWWSDPVLAYQLQHPMEAAYGYAFPSHAFSQGNALQRVADPPSPPIAVPPIQTITTQAGGAGHRIR